MKEILTMILSMVSMSMLAQVTFTVNSHPSNTPAGDNIYIVGSFNGWNPGDPNFMLKKNGDEKWEITLDAFAEGTTIEYKFTRGSWATVEKGLNGEEIANRVYTFGNAETVFINIYNWADNPPSPPTVSENVMVMDDNFYMPQLNRYRRIWLYLPPDYDSSNSNYPVLYMHDGQNLFDGSMSYFGGEWQVDDTLDDLAERGYQVPIVVGIDNSEFREDEYLGFPGGDGDDYLDFIVETLKPYIDENYRTLSDRENTGIMGSSFGGVISFYAALKYQNVFSKAGLFSPAYWAKHDFLTNYLIQAGRIQDIRFYQNAGETEGGQYINPMNEMENNLKSQGFQNVLSKVIPQGTHSEATWASDFESAYLWLFNPVSSAVENNQKIRALNVFPNPVRNILRFYIDEPSGIGHTVVTNIAGKTVLSSYGDFSDDLNVGGLSPGMYLVRLEMDGRTYIGRFVKI